MHNRRPELMPEHRHAEEHNRQGQWRRSDEQRGWQQTGCDYEAKFARRSDGPTVPDQITTEPTAEKTARAGECIGNPGEIADLFDIQMAHIREIFGQPEDEEIPGGVAQKFGGAHAKDTLVAEQRRPPWRQFRAAAKLLTGVR